MRSKTVTAALVGVVAAMCAVTMAQADAVCVKDYRDTTPAEKARITAIHEIIRKSLPPAPTGWQIGGHEEYSVAQSVCRDNELHPWGYSFTRNYNRVDDAEAREQIMRDAATHVAAEQAKKQPRMDALMAQMQEISGRQVALIQKGDMAGAEKLNHEMVKVQAEFQKVADEGDSQARIAAAGKETDRDRHLSVSVRVNEISKMLAPGAANITLPAGATAAQRWTIPADANQSEEGHALVLFGTWRRVEQAKHWKAAQRANAVPTAAHVISVEIVGDPSRIDPMLQAIDFQTLRTAFTK